MEKLKACPYCEGFESGEFEDEDGKFQKFNFCPICGKPFNEAGKKILAARRAAPENEPLTLEQLRQMDGEPVWIALLNIAKQPTCEVITKICEDGIHTVGAGGSDYASFGLYDKTWLAYARKLEGSDKS